MRFRQSLALLLLVVLQPAAGGSLHQRRGRSTSDDAVELEESGDYEIQLAEGEKSLRFQVCKVFDCPNSFKMLYGGSSGALCFVEILHVNECTNYELSDDRQVHGSTYVSNSCGLNVTSDGVVRVSLKSKTSACTVRVTNGQLYVPDEDAGFAQIWIWVIVGVVVVAAIVVTVVIVIVCRRKKQKAKAAAQAKLEEEKKKQLKSSEPFPAPPPPPPQPTSTAPVSAAPSSTAPTQAPSTEQIVAPPVPPTKPVTAPPAPATEEGTVDEFVKKEPSASKPKHWTDANKMGVARMHDSFAEQRSRGSAISKPLKSIPRSKVDSIEIERALIETALESFCRHGFLDDMLNEEMNMSREEDRTEPAQFTKMKAFYDERVPHVPDSREIEMIAMPVGSAYRLCNELRSEAKQILKARGVQFPTDGSAPTISSEVRAFLSHADTHPFIRIFALSCELAPRMPTGDEARMKKILKHLSIQALLIMAFRKPLGETMRHKILAAMGRKIVRAKQKYDEQKLHSFCHPCNLIPLAYLRRPLYFEEPERIQTDSMPNNSEESMRNHPDPAMRGVKLKRERKKSPIQNTSDRVSKVEASRTSANDDDTVEAEAGAKGTKGDTKDLPVDRTQE